ncbi:MAG: HupE/UreJ family protein [Bacteroidales bacterium]|nr:HupE/UreJ family protein [Bacteroidales bacterium]
MNIFYFYFKLGVQHILDLQGYDHILFIAAMTAVYVIGEWKHVLVLATAFTIGHTTTLALATLNLINVPTQLIEALIAFTIFLTGFFNLFKVKDDFSKKMQIIKYFVALFFGLIHGLGFSNYLKYLLGEEMSIVKPLFAFNLGLEIGQIVIISAVLFLSFLLINKAKVKRREWNLVISGAAMGIALMLLIDRLTLMF